ncbi:response regulator [Roseburia hominis]
MKKVMIVEDEEFILQGIRNILDWDSLGLEVAHMARNGQEAFEMWQQEPVDIVITDLSMPVMDGLTLLKKIRSLEESVRFIILTGYDEFEYAREAIRLEVENYILKPIDEEELKRQLCETAAKIDEMAKKKIKYIDEKAEWLHFLSGKVKREEYGLYERRLDCHLEEGSYHAAIMKWSMEGLKEKKIADVIVGLRKAERDLRVVHLPPDSLLMILKDEESGEGQVLEYFMKVQSQIESHFNVMTFICVGPGFQRFEELPEVYKAAMKLQKYLIIEGYGSCISAGQIRDRKSEDVDINESQLRKLILKKEKEAAVDYLEDLFINNIQRGAAVDTLYKMAVKIAMLLQEIKKEYKLEENVRLHDMPELIETIYQADNILGLKTAFISEITEIITSMHEEDSQYTPVVRQIIAEVQRNYKEDMNLKTLAYKYHMNASYLGQIFQKEVGCSFAQYLSNTKNSIAKDLILNTNMKINDIAKEVGYPDTSYFYRKFKQCYGVSPASLREMKKY